MVKVEERVAGLVQISTGTSQLSVVVENLFWRARVWITSCCWSEGKPLPLNAAVS
jgi:hypothetical protein